MTATERAVTFVVVAILGSVPSAIAQVSSTTGAILGTVYDDTKAVVPGVTITATGSALMGERTVITDSDGAYRLPALSPGLYTLVFELPGFATITRQNVAVSIGFTATITCWIVAWICVALSRLKLGSN